MLPQTSCASLEHPLDCSFVQQKVYSGERGQRYSNGHLLHILRSSCCLLLSLITTTGLLCFPFLSQQGRMKPQLSWPWKIHSFIGGQLGDLSPSLNDANLALFQSSHRPEKQNTPSQADFHTMVKVKVSLEKYPCCFHWFPRKMSLLLSLRTEAHTVVAFCPSIALFIREHPLFQF